MADEFAVHLPLYSAWILPSTSARQLWVDFQASTAPLGYTAGDGGVQMLCLHTAQHIWKVLMVTDGRKSFQGEREREKWTKIKVKEEPVRCKARRTLKGYTDTNALRGGFVCVCVCLCVQPSECQIYVSRKCVCIWCFFCFFLIFLFTWGKFVFCRTYFIQLSRLKFSLIFFGGFMSV